MKKYVISFSVMAVALVALTVVQAVVANSVSTVGVDISKIQKDIDAYRKENALLKEKLLTASSYTSIAEKASKKGLEPVKKQLTLTESLPLALR